MCAYKIAGPCEAYASVRILHTIPFVVPLAETAGTAPGKKVVSDEVDVAFEEKTPFAIENAFNGPFVAAGQKYTCPFQYAGAP